MASIGDQHMLAAIRLVHDGWSIRSAAKRHRLSRDTLSRRLIGGRSSQTFHADLQRLSPVQEKFLADWALCQASLGYAPPCSRFRLFAQSIYYQGGGQGVLGVYWCTRFLRRHQELKSLRSVRYDWKRANAAQSDNIVEFFGRLDDEAIRTIPPCHTYNADEIGTMLGIGDNPLVVGTSELKEIFINDPLNREWVTIIECVSGSGVALPPTIIYSGKSVQQQCFGDVFNDEVAQWMFCTSPSGWSANEIALNWLTDIFIPRTQPEDPSQWRHLIIDGHRSHTQLEFLMRCLTAKIWVDVVPAHTSQVLQPLGVGLFSVLKRSFRSHLRRTC